MKNIEIAKIEEIRTIVEQYKAYMDIYAHIESKREMIHDTYAYRDILEKTGNCIEEAAEDIIQFLNCIYEDWSGISSIKKDLFIYGGPKEMEIFWEKEERIREHDEEIEGVCVSFMTISDFVSPSMGYLPINFMREFIAEYDMFRIDGNNNVWVA